METKSLFQTVEDRGNIDEIESQGPFLCNRSNAWLGKGFYFWDSFLDLAHWWGRTVYMGKYVICRSYCDSTSNKVYDLYNDFETLKEFADLKSALQDKLHISNISVGEVLCYLIKNSDFTNRYQAIRAKATGCMRHAPTMRFVNYNSAYLELMPPVQFCVLDKRFLVDHSYRIVYPSKYVSQHRKI